MMAATECLYQWNGFGYFVDIPIFIYMSFGRWWRSLNLNFSAKELCFIFHLLTFAFVIKFHFLWFLLQITVDFHIFLVQFTGWMARIHFERCWCSSHIDREDENWPRKPGDAGNQWLWEVVADWSLWPLPFRKDGAILNRDRWLVRSKLGEA